MEVDGARSKGEIIRITIENFKSYAGKHTIETWRKLSCVVGPNGAGKSNFMDALCFGLAVPIKMLRARLLKELVSYEFADDAFRGAARVYVEIILTRDGSEAAFRRTIYATTPGSKNTKYATLMTVNNDRVTLNVYKERLQQFHINLSARNFLVFQGDVGTLGSCSGDELLAFLEQTCGSDGHKAEYDMVEREKLRVENEISPIEEQKRLLTSVRRQMRQYAAGQSNFQKLREQRTEIEMQSSLFHLYHFSVKINQRIKTLVGLGQNVAENAGANANDSRVAEMNAEQARAEMNAEQARADLAHAQAQEQVDIWNTHLSSVQSQIDAATQVISTQVARKTLDDADMLHRLDVYSDMKSVVKDAKAECEEKLAQIGQCLETEKVAMEGEVFAVLERVAENEGEDRADVVRKLSSDVEDGIRQASNEIAEAVKFEVTCVDSAAIDMELFAAAKVKGIAREVKGVLKQHDEIREELKQMEHNLEAFAPQGPKARELDELEQEMKTVGDLLGRVEEQASSISHRRRLLEETLPLLKNVDENCKIVFQLFAPCRLEFQNAVLRVMENHLYAVVCQDFETAQRCIQFLKSRRLEPVQLLALDSVPPSVDISRAVRHISFGNPRLAMHCITLKEEQYRGLFESLLGQTIIVDDLSSAAKIALEEPHLSLTVVALDGTMVREGCISTNSPQESQPISLQEVDAYKKKIRSANERLDALHREKRMLETNCAELRRKLGLDNFPEIGSRLKTLQELQRRAEQELASRRVGFTTQKMKLGEAASSALADVFKVYDIDLLQYGGSICQRIKKLVETHFDFCVFDRRFAILEDGTFFSASSEAELRNMWKASSDISEVNNVSQMALEQLEAEQNSLLEKIEQGKALVRETATACVLSAHNKKTTLRKLEERLREDNKNRHLTNAYCCAWLQHLTADLVRGTLPHSILLTDLDVDEPVLSNDPARIKYLSLKLDYRILPDRLKKLPLTRVPDVAADLTSSLEKVNKKLAVGCPAPSYDLDMSMEEIAEQLKKLSNELGEKRANWRNLDGQLQEIFKKRKAKLQDLVQFVQKEISVVYRLLNIHLPGAESYAYLDFVDDNNPFSKGGGIKFTVMPYGKRFQEVSQMSAGERTVAALALLLTVHKWAEPPFLLLDEVDAFLDPYHISLLLRYIKDAPFQTIAISLKWRFFSTADALIGIMPEKGTGHSLIFSTDLKDKSQPLAGA